MNKAKILFLPKYTSEGASSRYRTHNYSPYFKKEFEVTIEPLFGDKYLRISSNSKWKKIVFIYYYCFRAIFLMRKKNKYDLLIIEKELFPYLPYFIEKIILRKSKYTLDFDDAISVRYRKKRLLREKINKLANSSLLCTVGNKWYWQEIKANNLKYLPTVLNTDKYELKNKSIVNKRVRIVWIGSKTTSVYLNVISEVLSDLQKKYNVELIFIGDSFNVNGLEFTQYQWSEKIENSFLSKCDIGIMPLLSTDWENGKCGFKLLQYLAAGIPVVASKASANEEIVLSTVGFVANSNIEWYKNLEYLIINSEFRTTALQLARKHVEENYSYSTWGPVYVRTIKKLLEGR